jgi:hypothetical protein
MIGYVVISALCANALTMQLRIVTRYTEPIRHFRDCPI